MTSYKEPDLQVPLSWSHIWHDKLSAETDCSTKMLREMIQFVLNKGLRKKTESHPIYETIRAHVALIQTRSSFCLQAHSNSVKRGGGSAHIPSVRIIGQVSGPSCSRGSHSKRGLRCVKSRSQAEMQTSRQSSSGALQGERQPVG